LKTLNAEADKKEKDRKMKDLTFRVPKSLEEGGKDDDDDDDNDDDIEGEDERRCAKIKKMLAATEDTDEVEEVDKEVAETKTVVIKAFRSSQQPTSTARGSNDPGPVEGPAEEWSSTTSSSQSTKEKLEATLRKFDRREEIRLKYVEMSTSNVGIIPEEHHDFMFEVMKIANERANAYQVAY
jgi:hypothetical protein